MACLSRVALRNEGDEYYLDKHPGSIKNNTWVWHLNHARRRALGIDIVPSPLDERIPQAEIIRLAISQFDQDPKDVWSLKFFSGMQQEVLGLLSERGYRLSDLVMDGENCICQKDTKQTRIKFDAIDALNMRRCMAKRLSKQNDNFDSEAERVDLSLDTKQEIRKTTIEDIRLLRDVYMAAKEADLKEAARQRKVEQATYKLKKAGRLEVLGEVLALDNEPGPLDHIRRAIANLETNSPNENEPVNTPTTSVSVEGFSHSPPPQPPPFSLASPTTDHSQLIIMTEPSVPMTTSLGPKEMKKSKKPKKGKKKVPQKEVTRLDTEPGETPVCSSAPSIPMLQSRSTVTESGEGASDSHIMSNPPSTKTKKGKKRANKKTKKAINPAAESEGSRPQYSTPKSPRSTPKGTVSHERTISNLLPMRRRSPSLTQASFVDEPSYDTPTTRVPTKTFSLGSWSAPVSERGASPGPSRE